MPRTPHSLVEPAQPVAEAGAAATSRRPARPALRSASSGSREPSSRVMRVSRVPRANASTRRRPATAACTKRSRARAYGSIEPLTSSSSTSRRWRVAGVRKWRRIGSPSVRSAARTVRRRSGRAVRCVGRRHPQRPARRAGEAQAGHQPVGLGAARRRRRRRSPCCRSTSVDAEAQLERRVVVRRRRLGSSPSRVVLVAVDGDRDRLAARSPVGAVAGRRCSQNTRNARSNSSWSSGRCTSVDAAGPVDVVAPLERRRAPSASANDTHRAHRHVEPGAAQHAGERRRPSPPAVVARAQRSRSQVSAPARERLLDDVGEPVLLRRARGPRGT